MTFKRIGSTAFIAIISALVTIAAFSYYANRAGEQTFEQKQASNITPVSFSEAGQIPVALDFRYAARMTTSGVVHIKTSYAPRNTSRGSDNPFRDFFGDDFNPFGNMQPYQNQPQQSSGSGVIISDDGYIVTNNHVIDGGNKIQVVLSNKSSYEGTVIGTDPTTDLALVKIDQKNLPFIRFGNSDSVEVGQWVLAVGNPFNLESTVTAGIVSAKGRNIGIIKTHDSNGRQANGIEAYIQTDAAVNPGNSGGALVNTSGQLVGINSAIATPTGAFAGYSFAVPVNIVSKVVNDLMKYGIVQRGYLGITMETVTDELSKRNNLDDLNGVYIDSVLHGSAAEEADLKRGDVIIKINEQPVNTSPQVQEQVSRYHPGDKVTVTFKRAGREKTVTTILKNKSNNTSIVEREENSTLASLGAEFSDLNSTEKKELGLEGGVKVLKLNDGVLSRNTQMKEGFIITQVDNRQINNLNDLKEALTGKRGGVLLAGRYPDYPGQYYYAFGL
ncbi:MAG: Do family serine endopeptidase [Chitinophagales bacterium]